MARVAPRAAVTGAVATSAVSVTSLSKAYTLEGAPLHVLEDVSFEVDQGEFVSFVGPSGSGKSTLLNIIAGLDEPDAGTVHVPGLPRRLGHVSYMPQKDVLLPWRSALDNAVLGLEVQGMPRREAREQARDLFAVAGLSGFEDSYPSVLSGGMRQRVAFLRTVLAGGSVMLLDEPFGALDALTRSEMHAWLLSLWEKLRSTVVLVTHDVEEALLLSDTVYVLSPRPGRVRHTLHVPLPRPRGMELADSEGFVHARANLLRVVREETT